MNNKIKTLVISLTALGVFVGGSFILNNPEPLSYDEYVTFVKVVNYEVEKNGGMSFSNVSGVSDFKDKLFDFVESREVTESEVVIDGEVLTADEYKVLRSALVQKARIK